MALRLDSANSEAALVDTNLARGDFTVCLWWYPLTLSGWKNLLFFQATGYCAAQTSGTTLYGAGTAGSTVSASTWYHIGFVNNAGTNHLVYLNGSLDITDTASSVNGGSWLYAQIGRWQAAADYANARFACIKIWSTALTQAEIAREMYTIRPQRTADLFSWHPCFPGATERVQDYSGSGYDLTEVNTLTDEDPPPVLWGGLPVFVVPAAAAGGDVTVSPSAITAVGATANPTVVLGSLSIEPAARTAVAASVAPTVLEGDVTVSPSAISAVGATANPTVVLGSLSIGPAARTAVAASVAPSVVHGSVSVAPGAISGVSSSAVGAVVLGSVSISPAVVTVVAVSIAPSVIEGGGGAPVSSIVDHLRRRRV